MPIGYLSIRVDSTRRDHHIWLNNGTWWVHFTIHFDGRKRRIRRSLRTRDLERAIGLRDELFTNLRDHGEFVASRRPDILRFCVLDASHVAADRFHDTQGERQWKLPNADVSVAS